MFTSYLFDILYLVSHTKVFNQTIDDKQIAQFMFVFYDNFVNLMEMSF